MKKYCIRKKQDSQKSIRKVYEYRELDAGIKVFYNGILDGIMDREYFRNNFTEVKG